MHKSTLRSFIHHKCLCWCSNVADFNLEEPLMCCNCQTCKECKECKVIWWYKALIPEYPSIVCDFTGVQQTICQIFAWISTFQAKIMICQIFAWIFTFQAKIMTYIFLELFYFMHHKLPPLKMKLSVLVKIRLKDKKVKVFCWIYFNFTVVLFHIVYQGVVSIYLKWSV